MGQTKAQKSYNGSMLGFEPAMVGFAPDFPLKSSPEIEFATDETESILFALAQAVEQRDHQTAGHCERLAFMGVAIGMALGLDRAQLLTLYRGGYLHDV